MNMQRKRNDAGIAQFLHLIEMTRLALVKESALREDTNYAVLTVSVVLRLGDKTHHRWIDYQGHLCYLQFSAEFLTCYSRTTLETFFKKSHCDFVKKKDAKKNRTT